MTNTTLDVTSQPVIFKDAKKLDNANFNPTQKGMSIGVNYMKKQYDMPTKKIYDQKIRKLDAVTRKLNISKQKNDMKNVQNSMVLLNI